MAKKGNGEGTISKLKDGIYCGRLTVGFDENGKQKRKAFYGKTKREVQEKMNIAKEALEKVNVPVDPNKITIGDWLDFWLDEYKKRSVRASTYHGMRSTIRLHLNPALGKIKLKDLKKDTIQKVINDLSDSGLSRNTVKKSIIYLHGALDQAVKNGLVAKNVSSRMKLPQEEKKKMRILTPDEQVRFIGIARNHPIGEMFILMLATGLRIGEATALTWGDIDFEKGQLSVNKTYTSYYDDRLKAKVYALSDTKTKAGNRIVPILPKVLELLKNRKPETAVMADLVFPNDCYGYTNPNIKTSTAEFFLKRFLKEANVADGVHLHTLRHTFATRGLENGIELKVMQELLGHANISITADTYTHILADKKKDSMMKLAHTVTKPNNDEQGDTDNG